MTLLALAVILGVSVAMPLTVSAAGAWPLADYINDYFVHGGSGTLTATVADDAKSVTGFGYYSALWWFWQSAEVLRLLS